MTFRGISLLMLSFVCLGCGVATVQPFVDALDLDSGAPEDASIDAGECESDLDCPPGEECEIEDAVCKPSGGGQGGRSGSNSGPG
ncbi:MAG: hypothetical protein WBB42_03040 [Polyangiales bacterium]